MAKGCGVIRFQPSNNKGITVIIKWFVLMPASSVINLENNYYIFKILL